MKANLLIFHDATYTYLFNGKGLFVKTLSELV